MPKEIDHTSLYYLTGYQGEGVLIASGKGSVLLADERTFEAAVDQVGRNLVVHQASGDYLANIGQEVDRLALADDPFELQPGMVTTMEPGIYIHGYGGVRIEDDVLITATGPKSLSSFPRELMVVG